MPERFRHSMDVLQGCAGKARLAFPQPALAGQRRSSLPHRGASCAGALCKAGFCRRPDACRGKCSGAGLGARAASRHCASACMPTWAVLDTRNADPSLPAETAGDESLNVAFFSTKGVEADASIVIFVQFIRACRLHLLIDPPFPFPRGLRLSP